MSDPQKGPHSVDGNKKLCGIKRHVLTCSQGLVLTILVTAVNVHDTQPAGALLALAVEDGWIVRRIEATLGTLGNHYHRLI